MAMIDNSFQQFNSMNNMSALQGAQMTQENASTAQQIQTIGTQIQAEAQKAEAQRHQIRMETQNKIREMANETMNNRLKTSDKHHKSTLDTLKS